MPQNRSVHGGILCFKVAGVIAGTQDQHKSAQAIQSTLGLALMRYNRRSKVECQANVPASHTALPQNIVAFELLSVISSLKAVIEVE